MRQEEGGKVANNETGLALYAYFRYNRRTCFSLYCFHIYYDRLDD